MVVPKLAKNSFYSSFWVWGQFQVSCVSMPSVASSSFPKYEGGINIIFDHFRNRHARYTESRKMLAPCTHIFQILS